MIALATAWAAVSRAARSLTPQAWVIITVLGLGLFLLAYCTSQARQDERIKARQREAAAMTAQMQREAEADDAASNERLSDLQFNIDREKERSDATASIPDSRPSDRRIARACVQLRQQGTAARDLPSACI